MTKLKGDIKLSVRESLNEEKQENVKVVKGSIAQVPERADMCTH